MNTQFPICPQCGESVCPPNIYGMAKCFACHIAFEAFDADDIDPEDPELSCMGCGGIGHGPWCD